jgi:hypothetical protein
VQFDSLKAYGAALFSELDSIRSYIRSGAISKDSARILVAAARDQFVAAVSAILTVDQQTLFNKWIVKFWDPRMMGGRRHGPGHGSGPGHGGGPGGHG